MKITLEWLKEHQACKEGFEWSVKRLKNTNGEDPITFVQALLDDGKDNWARWTIVRVFDYKQRVQWSVFSAELVIQHYEQKYPEKQEPRKAIEAAKRCIDNPSDENKQAHAAAYAASADAADAAASAAYAAAYAADAAACAAASADAAASAAYAAAYAAYADADADAAADAAAAARRKTTQLIFEFGFSLILRKEGKENETRN